MTSLIFSAEPSGRHDTTISVSRPGYLGTPLNDNAAPEAQADLLAALLDVLEIGSVIVFAISGGGYSALHFAERHPDRCRGLVLCSTTGGPNTDPIPFAFTVMKAAARVPFLLAVLRKRAAARPIASLRRSISHEDILEETLQNQKSMALYQELTCSTMTRMAERLPGTINDIKVTQRASYVLNTIQVPTLVVHGTDDKVVPFAEHGARLAREIPNARLCTAERGEHVAIFSHNTQIVDAVDDFLAQL